MKYQSDFAWTIWSWPHLHPGSIPGISTKLYTVYTMRRSRKKRPQKPLIPHFAVNQSIKADKLRVLDDVGENIGVLSREDALKLAEERELDLVEINPKADPPVAKLVEFTNFKYQKEKEAKKQKLNSHVSETKGIRLTMSIGQHDLEIRQIQAEKFLNRGDKVKIEMILRGREKGKVPLGIQLANKFITMISETTNVKIEQETSYQGGKVTAIITKK